jgi:Flp pilus assembly protein TadG
MRCFKEGQMQNRRMPAAVPFVRDEPNSAIVMFVLMTVALLLAAGAAVDYARVANMRDGLELGVRRASKAALEALGNRYLSDDQIRTIGVSQFDKSTTFARQTGTIGTPKVIIDRDDQSIAVQAEGTVAMTASRLGGINEVSVPATYTAVTVPTFKASTAASEER